MKKQQKNNKNHQNHMKNERKQSVDDYLDQETGKPIPQPKDYEEIDY
ncbi:hypothetical protein ACFFF5_05690 [Lederbergia wuyishanensis]|uniref:Uncharacterized protein n=1 Tax=Lederbergia wuyishanensis TaxID=1347903 RepID=A0ABU0CYR0_9BACI|nr:hypothetical protein [Lederbergia wuyishanensis]MCJ8005925.1 hypothetical protein [Lederbergia wuyishanensis]MDQ0341290.1 hypothetical protein [Lederbergia wuyishanensis]